jgi:SlyX protein
MSDQRFVDLETKVAFQEIIIEELKQTMHLQYLSIEKLEKNLKQLTERLKGSDEGIDPSQNRPPHY